MSRPFCKEEENPLAMKEEEDSWDDLLTGNKRSLLFPDLARFGANSKKEESGDWLQPAPYPALDEVVVKRKTDKNLESSLEDDDVEMEASDSLKQRSAVMSNRRSFGGRYEKQMPEEDADDQAVAPEGDSSGGEKHPPEGSWIASLDEDEESAETILPDQIETQVDPEGEGCDSSLGVKAGVYILRTPPSSPSSR
jgi:hypothetical protein